MGDRCYWEAWVRKEDAAKFAMVVFRGETDPEEVTDRGAYFSEQEADYGHAMKCSKAAELGCVFIVEHGSGEYAAGHGVSDGGIYHTYETGYDGEGFVVRTDPTHLSDLGDFEKTRALDVEWHRLYEELTRKRVVYRAKSLAVEAIQLDFDRWNAVAEFIGAGNFEVPERKHELYLRTPNGMVRVLPGEWIVKSSTEMSSLTDDEFRATYEVVDAED